MTKDFSSAIKDLGNALGIDDTKLKELLDDAKGTAVSGKEGLDDFISKLVHSEDISEGSTKGTFNANGYKGFWKYLDDLPDNDYKYVKLTVPDTEESEDHEADGHDEDKKESIENQVGKDNYARYQKYMQTIVLSDNMDEAILAMFDIDKESRILDYFSGEEHGVNVPDDNPIKPSHYMDGEHDLLSHLEDVLTYEQMQGAYKFNIIKYAVRYDEKNGVEDLQKLLEYAKRLKDYELRENK